MPSKCSKCGSVDNYNFALNVGLCNICIAKELERIQELEVEIAKRPAKPLFGEARSSILKAMDNSANINDAIEKYDKLKERIENLEAAGWKFWRNISDYAHIAEPSEEEDVFIHSQQFKEILLNEFEQALKGE